MAKRTNEKRRDSRGSCFVIAPMGQPESDARVRLLDLMKHVIQPACQAVGLSVRGAHELTDPGVVTGHVVQQLIDATIVIADLTEHNVNVFYELGIRHALAKPCVLLVQDAETLPFNVAGLRTVTVNHGLFGGTTQAIADMTMHLKNCLTGPKIAESPLKVGVDLSTLRSDRPQERLLKRVVAETAAMSERFDRFERILVGRAWAMPIRDFPVNDAEDRSRPEQERRMREFVRDKRRRRSDER